MLKSDKLGRAITKVEKEVWCTLCHVANGFFGNYKDPNNRQLVANLTENFRRLGCRTSVKVHLFNSSLNFFLANLGNVSKEHDERFNQDIVTGYQRRWNNDMMGDYIWSLVRKDKTVHLRKSQASKYLLS